MSEQTEGMVGRTKEVIEVGSKIVIGFLGLCYVTGLMMVNQYYNRFGVYSLGLFRLNYVLAGAWVIAPIVGTSVLFGMLLMIFKSVRWYRQLVKGKELYSLYT